MTMSAPGLLTGNASAAGTANYNTASVTPANNARVLIFVLSGKASNLAETPTGVSHPSIGALTKLGDLAIPNNNLRISIWTGVGKGVAGAFTITHASAMNNCAWQVVQLTSDVATPTIAQVVSTTSAVSGVAGATLATPPGAASCVMGVIGYNAGSANAITIGTGFAAIGTLQSATGPTVQLWSEYDNTSPSDTPSFSVPTSGGRSLFALEVVDGTVSQPATNNATWWNGTAEVPAYVTWWDGTNEVPVTLS